MEKRGWMAGVWLVAALVAGGEEAQGRALLRGDTAAPATFSRVPTVREQAGRRVLSGPGEWRCGAVDGLINIRFGLLGFESGQQQDLLVVDSAGGKPYAVIRNINSSGRLDGRTVIAGAGNRYKPGFWHQVEIALDTRRGRVRVTTDGQVRFDAKTAAENTPFAGLRFASLASLSGLAVDVRPLPVQTSEELRLRAGLPTWEAQVRALPETSPEARRRRSVLGYQVEQIVKAVEQEAFVEGAEGADDLLQGLARETMGRYEERQLWLAPVEQVAGNPYLDPALNEDWYRAFASRPDDAWRLPTREVAAYDGLHRAHGIRDQAINANSWMMLYAHPQSPLRDKPELLLRALRRIDAYMGDYLCGRRHDDFFALGPALMAAVMIDKTYPELLLPKQRARWLEAARIAGQTYEKMGFGGDYANADLGTARIFLCSGLFTGDKTFVARGMKMAFSWNDNIYEDGASAYIAKQNESPGYHGACIDLAYDVYVMTRDPKVLEMLRRVELYPISISDANRTTEWYTPPSWKQSWYGAGSFAGAPVVYYLTGNRYYKTLGGVERFEKPAEPSMKLALVYRRHGDEARPLPENYVVYDRNIQGVRLNYGRFSAAMNGRTTDRLVGKNTLVGLTLAEPPQTGQRAFSAAVYGINAFPLGANTMSRESISVTPGRDFAALGADYTLARRMAGPSRREVPWRGRQVWLYLPDRLIGLVELTPEGRQNAQGVTLNIELGRARSGAVDSSPARLTDGMTCRYGDLVVRVRETNLKGIRLSPQADGQASDGVRGPHNEFHLVDEANLAAWAGGQRPYEGTSHAVVELRPVDAPDTAVVRVIRQNDVLGLSVTQGEVCRTVFYNAGTSAVSVASAPSAAGARASFFADRTTFAPPAAVPALFVLPARQSAVIVRGDDPRLHRSAIVGWRNFLSYYERHREEYAAPAADVR